MLKLNANLAGPLGGPQLAAPREFGGQTVLWNWLDHGCPSHYYLQLSCTLYARWEYHNIVYRFNRHSDGSTCREHNSRAGNVW